MKLGKVGVFSLMDGMTAPQMAAFAKRMEKAGYGALWFPEGMGRNSFQSASWLLANTETITVATGIATIYGRDANAAAGAQIGLNEQSGGRFLLGLGVSHESAVRGVRGHDYGKPVATMKAYLEAMAQMEYGAPPPPEKPLTVIAALGPKMLELARDKADGAHPYNVTPAHTKMAREILGPDKLLCVELMCVAETDPARARTIARSTLGMYLAMPNYQNNFKREGFTDGDLVDGGSDRLIDATIAWGDDDAILEHVEKHFAAGADHVCIQLLGETIVPDADTLERLALKLL